MTLAVRIILVVSTLINFTIIGVMVAIAFDNTSLAAVLISLPALAAGGVGGLWFGRKLVRQQREYQSKLSANPEDENTTANPPL